MNLRYVTQISALLSPVQLPAQPVTEPPPIG
jgi:hypothetical protein